MKIHSVYMTAATLLLSAASLSAATIPHTWVSPAGNDGTCTGSYVSPCATFQRAYNLTSAGGLISVLGPGDYGPLAITQSITIDGTNGGSIGFAGDSEAIYIDPSANANIVLRNLTIDGGGMGASAGEGTDAIFIASAGTTNVIDVMIDNCYLEGFSQIGVGLGSESPTYVTIKNTTIQGGTLGVRTFQNGTVFPVTSYDHVSLDHVTIQGAISAGVFARNGSVDISNSNITADVGASVTGIEADTYATLNVQNTMITSNTEGVCIYTNSTAIIGSSTTVIDNATNIYACGGVVSGVAGAGPSPKI